MARRSAHVLKEDSLTDGVDALLKTRYAPAALVIDEQYEVRLFRGKTGPFIEHAPGAASTSALTMLRVGILELVVSGIKELQKGGRAVLPAVWLEDDSGDMLLVAIDIHRIEVSEPLHERLYCVVFKVLARKGNGSVDISSLEEAQRALEVVTVREELARATVAERETRLAYAALQRENVLLRNEARAALREATEKERELVRALNEAKERQVLSTAIRESIGEGVVVAEASGSIIRVNEALCGLVGGSRGELLGRPIQDAVPLSRNGVRLTAHELPTTHALLNAQSGVFEPVECLCLVERKDGSKVRVAVLAKAIEVEGRVIGTVSTFRDLTNLEKAQHAKEEFISLASHQLRTPLSVIALNLELLERSGNASSLSSELRGSLATMKRASKRMVELMNMLLSLAKVEAGSLEPSYSFVAVPKLIRELVEQLQPMAREKEVRVEVRCEKALKLRSDPQFLHMILQNLMSNAIKYCKQGGHVRCTASAYGEQGVSFTVKDDGIGIPRAVRPKIFSRLFRADNAVRTHTEGTGLGLYLTHALVHKLGGEISFTSQVHHGTTFYVKLPGTASTQEGT